MCAAGKYLGIEGMRDTDHVVTTHELALWAKERGIRYEDVKEGTYDSLMGEASGAGVIFGNTGGVMEAALRTAYEFITHQKSPDVLFDLQPVRGLKDVREASLDVGGKTVNVAVVYGTASAGRFIEEMKKPGAKQYHFVEVMTCPGPAASAGADSPSLSRVRKTPSVRSVLMRFISATAPWTARTARATITARSKSFTRTSTASP